jgi:CBS domain-containing protein
MKVQEIMTREIASVTPRASLRTAARKMNELGVGSLLVVEDDRLLGIITDRDIACHAVALGRDANETDVQKVMTREVATCFDDQDITDAAHLMRDRHIRRVAVVNHDNRLAGLLSVDDLARSNRDLAGGVLEAATPIH